MTALTATLDSQIAVQQHNVEDLDRRVRQIDSAIEKATEKGRTTAAMKLAEDQRRARAGLVQERKTEAATPGPHSKQNALRWPLKEVRSRQKPRPSATSPNSSAPTPTASGLSGG